MGQRSARGWRPSNVAAWLPSVEWRRREGVPSRQSEFRKRKTQRLSCDGGEESRERDLLERFSSQLLDLGDDVLAVRNLQWSSVHRTAES